MSTPFEAKALEIATLYFDALRDGRVDRVPWADHVVLHTPLRDEPLTGREAVESFFRPMTGNLGEIRLDAVYLPAEENGCFVAEAHVGPLHVMDKFVVAGDQIQTQINVFDPRPAL